MNDNQSTVIYIESNEETWGDDWKTKPILRIEYAPETVGYIFSNAQAFVQETFSDSGLDIETNGYRTLDDDAGIQIRGTLVVLPVRPMTIDECIEYEDGRDRHKDETYKDLEADRQCDRARYPNEN